MSTHQQRWVSHNTYYFPTHICGEQRENEGFMRDSALRPQVHNVHAALYCTNENTLRIVFQILSVPTSLIAFNYSLADTFHFSEKDRTANVKKKFEYVDRF
jgi:hypothetical protein